jgi:CelD/BcsL family acetyltransferase involved in cellulose biosynthesis
MMSHPASPFVLHSVSILDPRWTAFVDAESAATPFHHPAWGRLVERCYGHRPFVFVELHADNSIRAGLPMAEVASWPRRRRWISLPFVDYCPPLGSFTDPAALPRELVTARERAGVAGIQMRAAFPGSAVHRESNWVRHVLPLGADTEAQFQGFHRMTRRNVRHAERSGLVIREEPEANALTETFYGLHVETRRRLGVPVQPRRFFRLLWEELIAADLGFVLIAYAGSKPVAGGVFLTLHGNIIYKFGASDAQAWSARPNNLLFWHAIRRGIETGATSLDFGRTDLVQDGLRSFKAGWGTREEPLVYSYLPERPRDSVRRVSSVLAPAIRRSPRWMTQLLGELLYRYAA